MVTGLKRIPAYSLRSTLVEMVNSLMTAALKSEEVGKVPDSGVRAVVKLGLQRSVLSLFIKLATAGLTYAMLVVFSRTMDVHEYGLFAFGFSLATLLAIGASMGQQTAILRYWPEDEGRGDGEGALASLRAGWALTLIGGVGLTVLLCLSAYVYGRVGPGLDAVMHVFAASLLIVPMAAAEYGSSALRAQGSVLTALLPRDIYWRASVPLVVWALFMFGLKLSGVAALALAASVLTLVMILQIALSRMHGYANDIGFSRLGAYWRDRGKASRWFLLGTVVDSAALNMDIVLVGLFIAAESAGLYFNAFRTAGLMTLFLFAIIQVIAPMLSRHYHAGEMRKARAVTSFCAWAGFIFSLAVFALYALFGDVILSLFGEHFAEGTSVLLILSLGLLVDAATGPTRIVMNMTGHERQYVMIFGTVMGLGFLVQLAIIPLFGLVAAAGVNAGARIISQIALVIWARRHVGIDPSVLGVFSIGKDGA